MMIPGPLKVKVDIAPTRIIEGGGTRIENDGAHFCIYIAGARRTIGVVCNIKRADVVRPIRNCVWYPIRSRVPIGG